MATWTIGSVTITRVEEQLGITHVACEKFLPGFEREVLLRHLSWAAPDHYNPSRDRFITSVHSWLIRAGDLTVLLDTCGGNHKDRPWTPRFHRLDTPYLERLRAAGAEPEDVDLVLCTHLHADHVGWNTMLRDGRWVPTFPNARYLFSRTEDAYWDMRQNPDMAGDPRRLAYEDSVLPIVQSGQAVLIDDGYQVTRNLSVEAAPGHSAGHVVFKLTDAGSSAVFCGDVVHHALQVYAPHWTHMVDQSPAEAVASRRRVLEWCAAHDALLFPIHFGAPHVARIGDESGSFSARFIQGTI
ncbi:MAG TPA: MBL fold metallo-hydrolase [Xanthobacteraceae bacterium]|jgi:glyoxylase-like metal-dependent hydrolase (beta-lactamase superfamily II)